MCQRSEKKKKRFVEKTTLWRSLIFLFMTKGNQEKPCHNHREDKNMVAWKSFQHTSPNRLHNESQKILYKRHKVSHGVPFMSVFSARELGAGRNIRTLAKFQRHVKRQECQGNTWYMSTATTGWLWLGIITTVLPLMTAGANRDINATNGHPSGQAMPITPTGSWILTVAP